MKLGDVKDHLDSALTSIAPNIAEGNGKYSVKDCCRFFDTASGSALEGRSRPGHSRRQSEANPRPNPPGKEHLQRIVRMLMGLLRSQSTRDYGKRKELD